MDENYNYYKEHGICPQCGIREDAPGRVRCEICLARNAEAKSKERERETPEQRAIRLSKMKVYRDKIRRDNRSNGKCVWCGKKLSSYSICFCPDCRVKNQKNNNQIKSSITRSERPSYGICYRCGKNPVMNGKKLCRECYEQSMESLKIAQNSEKTLERRKYIRAQNNLIFGKKS